MRVLLIEPPKDIWFVMGEYLPPPYGIIQLATYLEKRYSGTESLKGNFSSLKEAKKMNNQILEVSGQEMATLNVKSKNRSTGAEILR